MIDKDIPVSEIEDPRREFRYYCTAGVLSLGLTLVAFGLVIFKLIAGTEALYALAALAVAQVVVQLRFFLHIDLKESHRDDLQLVLFATLIILIMVGGTIWILTNQHARMM